MPPRPRIGITVDNTGKTGKTAHTPHRDTPPPRCQFADAYVQAVADAGGLPIAIPQQIELIDDYLDLCDAIILTGGDDPVTEPFGQPTHPAANRLNPKRQAFELALIAACDRRPDFPVLGVCLGMQLMALHAGGALDQHLPDTLGPAADTHRGDRPHPLIFEVTDSVLTPCPIAAPEAHLVTSAHHQAVATPSSPPGRLRVVARAADGVIEAIDDPTRPFHLGVQWHPERPPREEDTHDTRGVTDSPLNLSLFKKLVAAARHHAARRHAAR